LKPVKSTSPFRQAADELVSVSCVRLDTASNDARRAALMHRCLFLPSPTNQPTTPCTQQTIVAGLRTFIDENKRDYVAAAGRFSSQQKDKIEEEVLQVVSTCRARLEQLTNSILAAQKQPGLGGRPLVNEQTVAHLHGAVGARRFGVGVGGRGVGIGTVRGGWLRAERRLRWLG